MAKLFREALKAVGLDTPEKMSSFKIAAMYSAANISSRKCRRELMKNLWHHFGKHKCSPEYQVHMLCDGHTKVEVNKIEYQYEEGEAPETLDYHQKNIAEETEAQLRVSKVVIILQ